MKRVGIFYFSTVADDAEPVEGSVVFKLAGGSVRVRLHEIEAVDEGEALDEATPMPGESVMNTHELPPLPKLKAATQ